VPPEDSIRCDQRRDLREHATAQALAEDGETPPFVVTQLQASPVQLSLENPILLAQEFDHVPLLPFHPAEERCDKEMQRNHCASLRHPHRRSSFKILRSPFLAEKIILSVHTGLRRGSLFHLRWDYVDFLNRVVRIPRTKSGRPHAVPLNATVLTTLQALYTERIPDCPFVFANETGRHAGKPVKDVKNGFHTALEIAEIKDFTWHDLRHTFASWLVMKGASLRSVAELLGHRGLRMVMRYAHLSPAYLSAEVGLLDAPAPTPPPLEPHADKRARKGQRAAKPDQRPAKVVEFPSVLPET